MGDALLSAVADEVRLALEWIGKMGGEDSFWSVTERDLPVARAWRQGNQGYQEFWLIEEDVSGPKGPSKGSSHLRGDAKA
jgi:hypothetical protein